MINITTTNKEKELLFSIMEKYDDKGLTKVSDSISQLIKGSVSIDDLDTLNKSLDLLDGPDKDIFKPMLEDKVAEAVDKLKL